MKRITSILIAVLLITPLAAATGKGPAARSRQNDRCGFERLLGELPNQHLGSREQTDLVFMREEEKLARDVYLSLYERWELRVFRQIAAAESRHMAWVEALMDRYGLEDPVGENGLGVFINPDLQSLYARLASTGAESVESALLVGAAIEDLDLDDLRRALERSNNEDLHLLYQNLMKGSRNHLRAFTRVLERYGVTFEPVRLTVEEYLEIVQSPQERGFVDASGELLCGAGPGR